MAAPPDGVRRLASQAVDLPADVAPPGTRGALLQGALRLFAERSYAGTSIRDIAAAADVRSSTLYAHFRSKEHILAELIELGHEEHHRRLSTALVASEPDPVELLSAMVRAHVRFHAELPMLAAVANAELHALSSELSGAALALRRSSEQLIEDVIAGGVDAGVFDPVDTWMAVAAIGGMGLRVANWYRVDLDVTPDDVADTYAEFARRIVGVGAPRTPEG